MSRSSSSSSTTRIVSWPPLTSPPRATSGGGALTGSLAQGIGTALYEEMPYSSDGQPLASTFMDYLVPGASEVPQVRIEHLSIPSPITRYGIKGMGEGGAI